MSNNFDAVNKALTDGADPAMLCATCPWDRNCITPPSMTRAQIDEHIKESEAKDKEASARALAEGKTPGMPVGLLMTTLMFSGRDTSASVCPVFALRLASSAGRQIVDGLKAGMQSWDDQQ